VKELCQDAGINADVELIKYHHGIRQYHIIPKYKLIASHTGRRTFITNSILAGIPLSVIQRITGHKKLVTLQKYVDIAEGIKVEEMEKLSRYFVLREKGRRYILFSPYIKKKGSGFFYLFNPIFL
jgi:integrase